MEIDSPLTQPLAKIPVIFPARQTDVLCGQRPLRTGTTSAVSTSSAKRLLATKNEGPGKRPALTDGADWLPAFHPSPLSKDDWS